MIRTLLVKTMLTLAGRLPLRALQALGAAAGILLWYSRGRMARVTSENIRLCFPELSSRDQARLARSSLIETGKTLFETAMVWTAPASRCEAMIRNVQGTDELRIALEGGTGLILVLPHLGNWEMVAHYLGARTTPVHMYQPYRQPGIDAWIKECRARTGLDLVPADTRGIRAQVQALKHGRTVSTMPDQEPDVHTGTFSTFFGLECLCSELVPQLATRTGAVVITASCYRRPGGDGFDLVLDPVELHAGSAIQDLNNAIEKAVRRFPGQYLWSYKRFRTRPPGQPELYVDREHPAKRHMTRTLLSLATALVARLPLARIRYFGGGATPLVRRLGRKYARAARVNIGIAGRSHKVDPDLLTRSSKAFAMSLGDTAFALGAGRAAFDGAVTATTDDPADGHDGGMLLLTPPVGVRDVALRYLASRHRLLELYRPNTRDGIDDYLRYRRSALGIAQVPDTDTGIAMLRAALRARGHVTLCPMQQPRLRGGEFVTFLGEPALTATSIVELAAIDGVRTAFVFALRVDGGFEIQVQPFEANPTDRTQYLLRMNEALERIVLAWPDQFRWQDKRFNIRPAGEGRLYR